MVLELFNKARIKVNQWFETSLGALWALESTRSELKKLKEPFAVSKARPKKAKEPKKAVVAHRGPRFSNR
jgi:hypothetical protein